MEIVEGCNDPSQVFQLGVVLNGRSEDFGRDDMYNVEQLNHWGPAFAASSLKYKQMNRHFGFNHCSRKAAVMLRLLDRNRVHYPRCQDTEDLPTAALASRAPQDHRASLPQYSDPRE